MTTKELLLGHISACCCIVNYSYTVPSSCGLRDPEYPMLWLIVTIQARCVMGSKRQTEQEIELIEDTKVTCCRLASY